MPVARVHLGGLHKRDLFDAAADGHRHAIRNDLLRGDGDRHQPRGALTVDALSGDRNGEACAQQAGARDVHMRGALLQGGPYDDILDFARLDSRAGHGVRDGMTNETGRCGGVERSAIGLSDRRAGGRDDNGFPHFGVSSLSVAGLQNSASAQARSAGVRGAGRRESRST